VDVVAKICVQKLDVKVAEKAKFRHQQVVANPEGVNMDKNGIGNPQMTIVVRVIVDVLVIWS
jgi:hypothetical protein